MKYICSHYLDLIHIGRLMKKSLVMFYALLFLTTLNAQTQDTTKRTKLSLSDVIITETRNLNTISAPAAIEGEIIHAIKKSDVIHLDRTNANVITNNARQVFGKIAGISIWENDASGIQINVSCRGLSPNRSWEFNVRQNGFDIAADPFGYPEAYYNPPLEAVEKINIIRGASSIQFGPHFGGMMNYILRKAPETKKVEVETRNSLGSYGLFSSFNSLGGTIKKFKYYGFYQYRKANGWRENNAYNIHNGYLSFQYAFTPNINLSAEASYMNYVCQQPGGLTDSLFAQNPQQSLRSRNWFNVPWVVPAITLEVKLNEQHSFSIKANGIIGERNSIGLVKAANLPDTLNLTTGAYQNRQLDRDAYRNFGVEYRHLFKYAAFNKKHALSFGAKYFYGNTKRNFQGKGDNGTDYNLNLQDSTYVRSLQFQTQDASLFAENLLQVTDRLRLTTGLRFEILYNSGKGRLNYKSDGSENLITPQQRTRFIALSSVGIDYNVVGKTFFYGNFAQAYRPVQFADLTPPATTDSVDAKLKDGSGFNADLGYRGKIGSWFNFDVNGFYIYYANKIGTITQLREDNTTFQLKKNLGTAHHRGFEGYIEADLFQAFNIHKIAGNLSLFASCAYVDARYTDFKVITYNSSTSQLEETNLKNKRVEFAPRFTNRFGATYTYRIFSVTYQINWVDGIYTDASNTEKASANGQSGKLNGYHVMDLSATLNLTKYLNFRGGVNNLANTSYSTRRAGGYPGPGLMPADGRNWYISLGVKF